MCFEIKQAISLFSKQLYEKYGICDKDYTVTINKEYVISKLGPYKKGGCGKNPETGKLLILINPDKFSNYEELKTTFYHEFRHVWQRKLADKYNIGYWICWEKKHENKDFYLFSPAELDANRFAKSNGQLDGYDVYSKCIPDKESNVWKELEQNKKVATEIAFNEGLYLLNSDTVIRLEELALRSNPEEHKKWLRLRTQETKSESIIK